MIRYSPLLLAILATSATAIAASSPDNALDGQAKNVTVIEKNQAFPLVGPLIVEDCATEDCVTGQT